MKKLLTKTSIILSIALNNITTAYAQIVLPKPETLPGPTETTQAKRDTLLAFFEKNVFGNLTQTLIAIAGIVAFAFVIFSGIKMVTGFGNEESYTSAKKGFFLALAGFGIALLAYAIVSIISSL